jgi:hypothetical protein
MHSHGADFAMAYHPDTFDCFIVHGTIRNESAMPVNESRKIVGDSDIRSPYCGVIMPRIVGWVKLTSRESLKCQSCQCSSALVACS